MVLNLFFRFRFWIEILAVNSPLACSPLYNCFIDRCRLALWQFLCTQFFLIQHSEDAAGGPLEFLGDRGPTESEVNAALRIAGGGTHRLAPGVLAPLFMIAHRFTFLAAY